MNDTFDIQNKITQVETHLQILYGDMASYLKTIERTKQKCVRLAAHVKDYSIIETPGLKTAFSGFSDCLNQMEDRRKEMYDRIQIKVYEGMKNYETACKDIKESMKICSETEQVQSKKQKDLALLNAKNKGGEISKITTARQALAKASSDTKAAREKFHKELENFEKQKIRDFKAIWSEYIHSHLMYHSKALETFTRAHLIINDVDEDEEMETVLRYTRQKQQQDEQLEDEPISSRPATPSTPTGRVTPHSASRSSLNSSLSVPMNGTTSLHHSTNSLPRHNSAAYNSPPHHSLSTSSLPVHSPHSPAGVRRSPLSASTDQPIRDNNMRDNSREISRGMSTPQLNYNSGAAKRTPPNSGLRNSRSSVPAVEDDDDFDDE